MNLRKFVAANTRDCLKLMRAELGADAMIVSTRKTAQGVEIVGASADDLHAIPDNAPVTSSSEWKVPDDEAVHLSPAARVLAEQTQYLEPTPAFASRGSDKPIDTHASSRRPDHIKDSEIAQLVKASAAAAEKAGTDIHTPLAPSVISSPRAAHSKPVQDTASTIRSEAKRASGTEKTTAFISQKAYASETEAALRAAMDEFSDSYTLESDDDEVLSEPVGLAEPKKPLMNTEEIVTPIMEEMRVMREWFASQMDALTWKDTAQANPLRREFWRLLVSTGMSSLLARKIVERLPDEISEEKGIQWVCDVLARNLRPLPSVQGILEKGGVYAIVGPTGVGKTTTTAKLAARCVVKYGAQSLGLITTDQYRIGAVDQLRTFGRILGVDVYTARNQEDLVDLLNTLHNKKLVLIDTTGISQRDSRMEEHLSLIEIPDVQRVLVLPAGVHVEQGEDIVQAYGASKLKGVIISKLDESVRIGGMLDVLIRHKLALHYLTTGQRVPEDLHPVNIQLLVHRTMKYQPSSLLAYEGDELDWAAMPVVKSVR